MTKYSPRLPRIHGLMKENRKTGLPVDPRGGEVGPEALGDEPWKRNHESGFGGVCVCV